MRGVRGGRIGMVFQDPMTSLNPVFTVGSQITETIRAHRKATAREAKDACDRAARRGRDSRSRRRYSRVSASAQRRACGSA